MNHSSLDVQTVLHRMLADECLPAPWELQLDAYPTMRARIVCGGKSSDWLAIPEAQLAKRLQHCPALHGVATALADHVRGSLLGVVGVLDAAGIEYAPAATRVQRLVERWRLAERELELTRKRIRTAVEVLS